MSLPNLCPGVAGKMSDRHGEEIVRLVAAGGPQQAQLWRQALEGQGVRCRPLRDNALAMR
jgi:hypothetical protein